MNQLLFLKKYSSLTTISLVFLLLFTGGCCNFGYDAKDEARVQGSYFNLHLKSDFNDVVQVIYWDKFNDQNKNEFIQFLNCYEYDEFVSTRSVHINAFAFTDLRTFIERDNIIGISVVYNGKTKNYMADSSYSVFINQADFL